MQGRIAKWWMPDDVVIDRRDPAHRDRQDPEDGLARHVPGLPPAGYAERTARLGNLRHPRLARLPQREPLPMNVAVPVPPIDAADCADRAHAGRLCRRSRRVLPAHPEGQPALRSRPSGFYRFWLITDIRRHLWGHTLIGREGLEYTGTGRELAIGFMIALAVLSPIYVVYFVLGLAAERLQAFASLPLFLILYVFGQYAAYRARRYRATRTIFRGVRFWMTGSAWRYAGKTFLWDLATLFSLGLALPWRDGGARALQDAEHPLRRPRRRFRRHRRRAVPARRRAVDPGARAADRRRRRRSPRRSPARRPSSCRSPPSSRRSRSSACRSCSCCSAPPSCAG